MNEEEFINELKKCNVILVDELHQLYISKKKGKEVINNTTFLNIYMKEYFFKKFGIE